MKLDVMHVMKLDVNLPCLCICKDVIFHECSPRFCTDLLTRYLKGYTVHQVFECSSGRHLRQQPIMLSPHHFGWPMHRPRAFTVLTKDAACHLGSDEPGHSNRGINTCQELFRKPCLSVAALYTAPKA